MTDTRWLTSELPMDTSAVTTSKPRICFISLQRESLLARLLPVCDVTGFGSSGTVESNMPSWPRGNDTVSEMSMVLEPGVEGYAGLGMGLSTSSWTETVSELDTDDTSTSIPGDFLVEVFGDRRARSSFRAFRRAFCAYMDDGG
jgi:hypothetical protein